MGKDGSLYFIPGTLKSFLDTLNEKNISTLSTKNNVTITENGYRVMRVTPPEKPPIIVDGKLPEGDVKIELM
jgi:hypothetical protein